MKKTRSLFLLFVSAFLICAVAAASSASLVKTPSGWHSGVGSSSDPDPESAGDEAAAIAKKALGGSPAKFVMVVAAKPLLTEALVIGVKKHFPADVIYGCEVTSPWTPDGNFPDSETLDISTGVAVWALGGDIDITAASVATGDDDDDENVYYKSGVKLAELLRKPLEESKRPGRLVMTWGDQYTGSNKYFARGLNDGFEKVWPIVGAASGNDEAKIIIKSEIVTGVNGGVVLAGDFKVFLAKRTGPHTPKTAEQTITEALNQANGESPFFGLLFNCRRRRIGMMNDGTLAEEHAAAMRFFPRGEFFGFYAPGEIGPPAPGQPSEGVGFSVVAALFFAL